MISFKNLLRKSKTTCGFFKPHLDFQKPHVVFLNHTWFFEKPHVGFEKKTPLDFLESIKTHMWLFLNHPWVLKNHGWFLKTTPGFLIENPPVVFEKPIGGFKKTTSGFLAFLKKPHVV